MKKTLKHTLSLVLALMMVVSTMAVSMVSTSAASSNHEYKITVNTGGSNATSIDIMSVTVHGTKGSTDSHNICALAGKNGTNSRTFTDPVDVGEITSIEIENIGIDDWYPNYVVVTGPSDTEMIYGGRWISDNKKVTLKDTDNVIQLDIKTSSDFSSGTDDIVKITLYDYAKHSAVLLDATEIHPAFNAFEKGDDTTLYIYAPNNFGKVDSINISLSSAGILTPGGDWKVENITATHVSGNNRGFSKTLMTDTWIDG